MLLYAAKKICKIGLSVTLFARFLPTRSDKANSIAEKKLKPVYAPFVMVSLEIEKKSCRRYNLSERIV
jgi:hypothetical protein